MSKHFRPEAAEKEANEIGLKFANSNDVVRDMSRAYHADFSSVKIHTDAAADSRVKAAGKDALAVGNDLFFGKGIFESSDPASRGLVAHELAHTMQQGAVEGGYMDMGVSEAAPMGAAQGGLLTWFKTLFGTRPENAVSFARDKNKMSGRNVGRFWAEGHEVGRDRAAEAGDKGRGEILPYLAERFGENNIYNTVVQNAGGTGGKVEIKGLALNRMASNLRGSLGGNMTNEQIGDMYAKLTSGQQYYQLQKIAPENRTAEQQAALDAFTPEQINAMDTQFAEGFGQLKGVYLDQMRRVREKYGTYITQMHPEEFVSKLGTEFFDDFSFIQDTAQMMASGGQFFDYENNAEDKEFKLLNDYYGDAYNAISAYMATDPAAFALGKDEEFAPRADMVNFAEGRDLQNALALEGSVAASGAKGFTEKQQRKYEDRVRKRFSPANMVHRLIGRFRRPQNGNR